MNNRSDIPKIVVQDKNDLYSCLVILMIVNRVILFQINHNSNRIIKRKKKQSLLYL